jgi:hypothetical protein
MPSSSTGALLNGKRVHLMARELSTRMTAAAYRALMQQGESGNKYHVSLPEQRRYNGILYHSAREARLAFTLDARVQAGEITSWARQVDFPLVVNGQQVGTYRADFVIIHTDATRELIEVKGYFPAPAKFRWRVFLALYQQEWESRGWTITLDRGARAHD